MKFTANGKKHNQNYGAHAKSEYPLNYGDNLDRYAY